MTVDKFKTKLMQDPNDIEACQVLAVALFVKGEEAQARRILEKAQTLHEDRGNAEEAVQIKHTLDPLQPNI
ncbi:MAG: hypothetical protein EA368_01010 [Leptolyngbya sp. DLM2.Bin27]|nr:MAG: hypothetical protein EA368_01010 [Leptolyngbya sp. DLM2.Bin27]